MGAVNPGPRLRVGLEFAGNSRITHIRGTRSLAKNHWKLVAILYAADRWRDLLTIAFGVLGPRAAYFFTDTIAYLLYPLLLPLRAQSEFQIASAFRASVRSVDARRLAREAFLHRMRDIADLLLAGRWLRRERFTRTGGAIDARQLQAIFAAQRRGTPIIFVTAYYGPFDLLPVLLGYNGVRAAVLYRKHANAGFDALRKRIRERSGCEMVPVERALQRLPQVLEAGGSIGVLADHHDPRRGLKTMFLGLPTRVPPTVALLAARYRADVVVAGIRRRGPLQFELHVSDVFHAADWELEAEPIVYITQRFLKALEEIVWTDPAQYHWARARWGPELLGPLSMPLLRKP